MKPRQQFPIILKSSVSFCIVHPFSRFPFTFSAYGILLYLIVIKSNLDYFLISAQNFVTKTNSRQRDDTSGYQPASRSWRNQLLEWVTSSRQIAVMQDTSGEMSLLGGNPLPVS